MKKKKNVVFLFLIMFQFSCVHCYAQFWIPFLQGVNQGLANFNRQQAIQRQQEAQRQREEEARKEREIHERKEVEKNGFTWIQTSQGTSTTYYGAKDMNGKELIPLSRKYTSIYFLVEENNVGYFCVEKGDKEGACDITGKEVVPCNYKSVFYGSRGSFVYQGADNKYHDLDVALNSEGKACKPDPDRYIDKEREVADDGYIWYATNDMNHKTGDYNHYGARTLDNKKIVPEKFSFVKYKDGYFIACKHEDDFETIYDLNGVCVLPLSRQYIILEIHRDEGWIKVARNTSKGKLAGAIDLRTTKEIVPLQSFCAIRYNSKTQRFETRINPKSAWVKTNCTLDKVTGAVVNVSKTSTSPSVSSGAVKYHYTKSGRGQSQNTGQWTDSSGAEECEVEFGDDGITINGVYYEYLRTSGNWKIYRGLSMSYGGSSNTSYYYVDANKNMKMVCETTGPGISDTYIYPMSRNREPTPQGSGVASGRSYGSDNSVSGGSVNKSLEKRKRDVLNSGGGYNCGLCKGTGKCFNCKGTGVANYMGTTKKCVSCKDAPGVCSQCHGTKVSSWNR